MVGKENKKGPEIKKEKVIEKKIGLKNAGLQKIRG